MFERSLIANLAAANDFHSSFMATEKVQSMLKSANIIYSAGFWVTVTPESMEIVGKHALENNKVKSKHKKRNFLFFVFFVCFENVSNVM